MRGKVKNEFFVMSADGRAWDAEEFAAREGCLLIPDAFVAFLRDRFGVEDYERLHDLMEIRAQNALS
jgi:hypothetical protein